MNLKNLVRVQEIDVKTGARKNVFVNPGQIQYAEPKTVPVKDPDNGDVVDVNVVECRFHGGNVHVLVDYEA